jgi:dienelactone hydrolase
VLDQHGLATLLIDLLTEEEETRDEQFGRLRFNITLLAERLSSICAWARRTPELEQLQTGLFGTGTGSAAALFAAAQHPHTICAVVSRGGRPDLAGSALTRVMAPTLLIVGEHDETLLTQNERAMTHMRSEVRLEVIPGATHLFEQPGAIEQVASLAGDWFEDHL